MQQQKQENKLNRYHYTINRLKCNADHNIFLSVTVNLWCKPLIQFPFPLVGDAERRLGAAAVDAEYETPHGPSGGRP